MTKSFEKVFYLFTLGGKLKTFFIFVLILATAAFDAFGLASIMPFFTILLNPDLIQQNTILLQIYNYFSFPDEESFLFAAGLAVLFLLTLSIATRFLANFVQIKFILNCEYKISVKLTEIYLNKSFQWFTAQNTAELGKTILQEVEKVVHHSMMPVISIITQVSVVLAIFTVIFFVDPFTALIVVSTLSSFALLIIYFTKSYLSSLSVLRLDSNSERFKNLNDMFSGIKDIKTNDTEGFFIKNFEQPAKRYANSQVKGEIVSFLPRYIFELIAFGGLMGLIIYLISNTRNFVDAIPYLSLYALAGYRLMPSIQQIYSNISLLRFSRASLDLVYRDLLLEESASYFNNSHDIVEPVGNLLKFDQVSFKYDGKLKNILSDISLEINLNTFIGIVGRSGSGKTTFVDLLQGLYEPSSGKILIDETELTKNNIKMWRQQIAYVPQQVYVSNASVKANIAFGSDIKNVALDDIKAAAKAAKIHDFIISQLSSGYDTILGERGVTLSGGQIQRIGLARALFRKPKILVLDESTSALDSVSETEIMSEIHNLKGKLTVIVIAHRISTVEKCEQIFLFENGNVFGGKDFSSMMLSDNFKKLALKKYAKN